VSGNDKSLLTERLFDGTTDRSAMGRVRKRWREHLKLATDDDLRVVLEGFRILEGHRSLEEVRAEINVKAQLVGLLAQADDESDFRYDELARQLKVRGINVLTRDRLDRFCREEKLRVGEPRADDGFLPVAIRSFLGLAADAVGAGPDETLMLTDHFRQRYLQDGLEWQRDIRPTVEAFLRSVASRSRRLRLTMDAHASIAFLAGSVLDAKAGLDVTLVQKGRAGPQLWRAADGTVGGSLELTEHSVGSGADIAVAIGLSQPVEPQALGYVSRNLPQVGRVLSFAPPGGPSQAAVNGGAHAASLAEAISNAVRRTRGDDPDAIAHLFAACPNSLLFYLGQQHQGVAPCIVYEFDFDRRGNRTYQPSFVMD